MQLKKNRQCIKKKKNHQKSSEQQPSEKQKVKSLRKTQVFEKQA